MLKVIGIFLPFFFASFLLASPPLPYLNPTRVEVKPIADFPGESKAYWGTLPFQWEGTSAPLRLSIESSSIQFVDSTGRLWNSLDDGERTLVPKEGEKNYDFKVKMTPVECGEESENLPTDGFVEVRGDYDLLQAVYQRPPILPSVLAPRMGKSDSPARRDFDQLCLTLVSVERKDFSTILTVHIEYENAFDFFDSHEERVARGRCVLQKILPSGKVSQLTPTRIRPIRQGENDAVFEYRFPIVRSQSFDPEWDFVLSLPSRLEHFSSKSSR